MKKIVKITLIGIGAVAVATVAAVGGFLIKYPFSPDVTVNSADGRIADNKTLKIASYNTAAPWGNLIEGTHSARRAHLSAQQINENLPDSFGVQEINSDWVSRFETLLPQYGYYGVKRGGDPDERRSEMSGIFYLKDKYELVESETFWISDTPETESKFDDAACYRICSYVVLKNKATNGLYIHINTHLDHVSTDAQALGGKLISECAEKLKAKYVNAPVVITGDFNQNEDDPAVSLLISKGFFNANSVLQNGNNTATYHAWKGITEDAPIDFILTDSNLQVTSYKVHNQKQDGSYASDHYMIIAEMSII